jgi:hypothetical protein
MPILRSTPGRNPDVQVTDAAGDAAQKTPRKCMECGGASIYQHQRIKSRCKEWGEAKLNVFK